MTNDPTQDLGLTAGGPASAPDPHRGLWVRGTRNHYEGIRAGQLEYVDPTDPEVIRKLTHGWLVPLPGQNYDPQETQ